MPIRLRGYPVVLVLFITVAIAACGSGGAPSAAAPSAAAPSASPVPAASTRPANQIDALDSYTFAPSHLSVKVGTEVTWFEPSRYTPHNVRLDGDPEMVIHPLSSFGDTYKYTFTRAGTFHFTCTIHAPGMSGDVVVEG